MKPRNPFVVQARARKAGPHSGNRRPDEQCGLCDGSRLATVRRYPADGSDPCVLRVACPACSGEEHGL